jgi:hypothetical protein
VEEQLIDNHWQLPPNDSTCIDLPRTSFDYSGEAHFKADGDFHGGTAPYEIQLPRSCASGAQSLLSSNQVALIDINRDGLTDIVQTRRGNNPIFINPPTRDDARFRTFSCSELRFTSGPLFDQASKGISVFGTWRDDWSQALLHRSGDPPSYLDGFPKDSFLIKKVDASPTSAARWEVGRFSPPIPTLPAPHLFGDLNTDGLVDALFVETDAMHKPVKTWVAFSTRNPDGTVAPFSLKVATNLYLGVGTVGSIKPAPKASRAARSSSTTPAQGRWCP